MSIQFNHKSKGSLIGSGTYKFRHYGIEQTQLDAPVISLSGSSLSWAAVTNASSYDLYKGGTLLTSGVTSPVTLSSSGSYQVKAIGDGTRYTDSEFSNTVTYTVTYSIEATPQNITAEATNPATIAENGTATLVFKANNGYKMPSTAPTVTGATRVSWTVSTTSSTDDTGTLVISNPTGAVSFTVTGEVVSTTYTIYLYCNGDTSRKHTLIDVTTSTTILNQVGYNTARQAITLTKGHVYRYIMYHDYKYRPAYWTLNGSRAYLSSSYQSPTNVSAIADTSDGMNNNIGEAYNSDTITNTDGYFYVPA